MAPTDDGIIVPPGLVARSLEGAKVVEIGAGVGVVSVAAMLSGASCVVTEKESGLLPLVSPSQTKTF